MVRSGTLYTPSGYPRSWRALIAAKYSKSHITCEPYSNAKEGLNTKFPPGALPVYEGSDGVCLFEISAIADFLGTDQLRGGSNSPMVTQWVNYAECSVLPAVAAWVYPCLSICQPNQKTMTVAKGNITSIMSHLNKYLSDRTYLVGESITLADITLFTSLYLLFTHVLDASYRTQYHHVERWYLTIANQPEVASVTGPLTLCEAPVHFDTAKFSELHGKQDKCEKLKAKDKPKASSQKSKNEPKSVHEDHAKADIDDSDKNYQEPKENPLNVLPPGSLVLDEFKRTYSNNDVESVGLPYLWQHFDPDHYSFWFCNYNYPEDLRLVFMSSNLIGGFFQRLEKMSKFAFAVMSVIGLDNENVIQGVWLWRGTGLIFDLDPDIQTDYESFAWRKLNHESEDDRQLISTFFTRQAVINGKPNAATKVFK